MTGTEPHAPRGTAGRGPNWDRGPRADHAGAARRCTSAGHRRPRDQLGPWAVRGPRRSCTALYNAAPSAVGSTGTIGRVRAAGATRRRMLISAPPAASPFLGSRAASGPEELRNSEWTYMSTHAYLCTAGRGTRKGTVGCERAGGAA
jgi:hypothetical protein